MSNSIPANEFASGKNSRIGQHFIADQVVDLAKIYKNEFSLGIWEPPISQKREQYAKQMAQKEFSFVKIVKPDTVHEALSFLPEGVGKQETQQWVAYLVDLFATLFGLDDVGLRIASHQRPMCPKFHFDRIGVRLVHSLYGKGSEWVEHPLFLQSDKITKIDPWIKKAEADKILQIFEAPSGAVALMKGANWKEGTPPVIHRSPQHDQCRVVLTLDQA